LAGRCQDIGVVGSWYSLRDDMVIIYGVIFLKNEKRTAF